MEYTDLQSHIYCANYTFLLGDTLISSKTDPHNGSKKEK